MPIANFQITQAEKDRLKDLLEEAVESMTDVGGVPTTAPGTHEKLYDELIRLTVESGDRPGSMSEAGELLHRFLHGARQVNADIGFFSIWVRGYTQRQIDQRTTVPDDFSLWIQEASNQIVEAITQQIIDNFDLNPTGNQMPTTTEVAFLDAERSVQNVLAQLNFRAGDSGLAVGAAWAGTPFFPNVGSPIQIARLLGSPGSVFDEATIPPIELDVFDDVRNILLAFDSMMFGALQILEENESGVPSRSGVGEEVGESVADDWTVSFDLVKAGWPVFDAGDLASGRRVSLLTGNLLADLAKDYPVLADTFLTISRYGRGRFLDDIRSSYERGCHYRIS